MLLLFLVGVGHTQKLIGDYVTATSTAHYWQPQVVGQFDYFADSLPYVRHRDLGGNVMIGFWADFQQPLQVVPARKDLHVADLMLLMSYIAPVANVLELFHVQGDVAKANVMEVTAKAANVANSVRIKRKNVLRYKNGAFRPTLCSHRLCLSS